MLFPEARDRPTVAPDGLFAERFELGEIVRRSPFATTFAAVDVPDGRKPCEVQVLEHARDLEALRELRATVSELPARRRVPLMAVGRAEDGRLWIELEPVPTTTLAEKLRRDHPLPILQALEVAAQVLEVLTEAHGRGLAHGALGLDTVLLEDEPDWTAESTFAISVRLSDLGLRSLGSNPVASEAQASDDAFADDRLAVVRILMQCAGAGERAVGDLRARLERGELPTAGFLWSAVKELQRERAARRRLGKAVLLPTLAVAAVCMLWLRERQSHAAAREILASRTAELAETSGALVAERERLAEEIHSRRALAERLRTEATLPLRERMERRWSDFLAEPSTADFREVAATARWFDDGRLRGMLERYVRALESRLVGEGPLAARFDELPGLPGWSAGVARDPSLSMTEAGAELLVLEHARKIVGGEATPGPLPPLLRARLPEEPGPLVAEIVRRSDVAASFPGPLGVLRVYREGGRWVTERAVGEPSAPRIERRVHADDGALLETSELATRTSGRAWGGNGTWERVTLSEEPESGIPLESLGVPTDRYRRFRRSVEGRPLDVLRAGGPPGTGGTLFLSPELGELRREGKLERELVYADLLP